MFVSTSIVIEGNGIIVDIDQLRYKLRLIKIYSTTNNGKDAGCLINEVNRLNSFYRLSYLPEDNVFFL